jgi:hypothetical protein
VPANAVITRLAPLARPSTVPTRRESIKPMKNVNAEQHRHAGGRVLRLLDGEHEAEGAGQEHHEADARRHRAGDAVDTPIQAPSTVGTIDSASSQYVLRSTRLR